MNRVKDYYNAAVDYLDLPIKDRTAIGIHFKIIRDKDLNFAQANAIDKLVFTTIIKNDLFGEFRKYVSHFRKVPDYDHYD